MCVAGGNMFTHEKVRRRRDDEDVTSEGARMRPVFPEIDSYKNLTRIASLKMSAVRLCSWSLSRLKKRMRG